MFAESTFVPVVARSTSVLGGLAFVAHMLAVSLALLGVSSLVSCIAALRSGNRADAALFAFWTGLNSLSAVGACL